MNEPIRIELPTMYGMKSVNAYLIKTPEPTLIDCGENSDASWKALQTALAEHELTIKDIKRIIITHAHVDHIGMAGRIVAANDAEVWVNEYCYDWAVQKDLMWQNRMEMMSQHLSNYFPPSEEGNSFKQTLSHFFKAITSAWIDIPKERVKQFPINGALHFGGSKWEVIYAPGHTNLQTCFYQKEKKWLLAADMLLSITPTPVLEFALEDYTKRANGLGVMLQSFEKFRALDIEKVFPGHYETFSNHRRLIDAQIRRIHTRKETTFELIQSGKYHFYELLETMYANRISMPAVSMLRGYLDLLLEEARIVEKVEKNSVTYAIV